MLDCVINNTKSLLSTVSRVKLLNQSEPGYSLVENFATQQCDSGQVKNWLDEQTAKLRDFFFNVIQAILTSFDSRQKLFCLHEHLNREFAQCCWINKVAVYFSVWACRRIVDSDIFVWSIWHVARVQGQASTIIGKWHESSELKQGSRENLSTISGLFSLYFVVAKFVRLQNDT